MELKLFRHLWGVDEAWETAFPNFKAAGYAGIESGWPRPTRRVCCWRRMISASSPIHTAGDDVAAHVASFRRQLARAAAFNPVLVNCRGGRDRVRSASEGQQFYAAVLAAERVLGVAVAHETHRGRILYNPWATRDLLRLFPDLMLSCDLSHWVCITERLLTSEGEIIAGCRALSPSARPCRL